MTERHYRKLTRFLFLLLFVVFFLLYLLLGGRVGEHQSANAKGIHEAMELGTVELSDVLSSGFIIDEFGFTKTTSLETGAQFDDCVTLFTANVKNIADVPVRVKMQVTGTDISSGAITNAGLHGFLYYFSGEDDPIPGSYRAALTNPNRALVTTDFPDRRISLTTDPLRYPTQLQLAPGEELRLMLVFWIDHEEALALAPDLATQIAAPEEEFVDVTFNNQYNVTVKLTSRAAAVL